MRLGTRIYHFNSGPPVRHDRCLGGNSRNYAPQEISFIEESINGPTLTDLLCKLPTGWMLSRTEGGNWFLIDDDGDAVEMGADLPQLLKGL